MWFRPTRLQAGAGSRCFRIGRLGRNCTVEQLEDRCLLSIGGIEGLGVLGDSLSDEYAGEWYSYARNWVELLAQEKGVPLGQVLDWGEPRREGYEFNWARSGATSGSLLTDGQHTGVAAQVAEGLVSHAVLAIGQNDFFFLDEAYGAIYAGDWSDQVIGQYTEQVLGNIHVAVQTLAEVPVDLVLCNIIDYGVAPLTRLLFSDPDGRQRVAGVIAELNDRIEVLARDYQIPLVDSFGFTKQLLGTSYTPVPSHEIGGQLFYNQGGIGSRNEFVHDGVHPHTISQAIFANLYLEGLSLGYGTTVPLFAEQEMVELVGLDYGGDTFGIAYSNFVVLPGVGNPAGVGDLVWYDLNGNGIQDGGEPGMADVRVELYSAGSDGQIGGVDDVLIDTMLTGTDGCYEFAGLPAGTYYLQFSNLPDAFAFTTPDVGPDDADSDVDPNTGRTEAFTLAPGQDRTTVDAGLVPAQGPSAVVLSDPDRPGETSLFVVGTTQDDRIVMAGLAEGDVRVAIARADGTVVLDETFQPSAGGRIVAVALEGDDRVVLKPTVTRDARLDGGPGNDVLVGGSGNDLLYGAGGQDILKGGSGNNILSGGEEHDRLFGNLGRDLLIGGPGQDWVLGFSGQDILIGGTTTHDADEAALLAILAEWTTQQPIAVRVDHLKNGGGLNGSAVLKKGQTVLDDQAKDRFHGGLGADWLFIYADDVIHGKSVFDVFDRPAPGRKLQRLLKFL